MDPRSNPRGERSGPPVQNPGQNPNDLRRLPWNHDLWIAPITSLEPLVAGPSRRFLEHAGVPHVIRDLKNPDRLIAVFQWFPMDEKLRESFDRIALRISEDNGKTWSEPKTIQVAGMDPQMQRPFDPTLLQLPDGRYRLFFTSNLRPNLNQRPPQNFGQGGQRPPEGLMNSGQRPGPMGHEVPRQIYSALSGDLSVFTFEEGPRTDRVFRESIVDATVSAHGGKFFMMAHPGPRSSPFEVSQGYFAVSQDGKKFERLMNRVGPPGVDFIGNLVSSNGKLHYVGAGPSGIWSMSSTDGEEWGRGVLSKIKGGDPSVFFDRNNQGYIVYVGDPRSDSVAQPPWNRGIGGPQN